MAEKNTTEENDESSREFAPGSIAFDLVTRQPLYIHKQVAKDLEEHQKENNFDLATYKMHEYLPIHRDDRVFECVFIETSPQKMHKVGKSYDFPEGRLMAVPVEQAFE
ncbi:hypothetical protein [Halocatena halophila]|uniref:hypothetical protein n=1 Tax=Halocatena halophila TaxID=2814576 RepID=UPI002ED69231